MQPNILYIHSHDTGRYVQPYGYAVPTPNLQKFAEGGMVFRKCFCCAPTCSASRAALLDLCDAGPLPNAQGRSMRGVLDGPLDPADWQDAYAEFFGQRFVYTQRITWHGRWKYVFSPGGVDELYDLADDPHERTNLAGDEAHRPVLVDMCKRMWRKMESIGDESLFRTHYGTLRTAPVGPLSIREEGGN